MFLVTDQGSLKIKAYVGAAGTGEGSITAFHHPAVGQVPTGSGCLGQAGFVETQIGDVGTCGSRPGTRRADHLFHQRMVVTETRGLRVGHLVEGNLLIGGRVPLMCDLIGKHNLVDARRGCFHQASHLL